MHSINTILIYVKTPVTLPKKKNDKNKKIRSMIYVDSIIDKKCTRVEQYITEVRLSAA